MAGRFLLSHHRLAGSAAYTLVVLSTSLAQVTDRGRAVYERRCASCHEQSNERIPTRQALQQMPAARILCALDSGVMLSVALTMHRDERIAVASYLGANAPISTPPPSAFCADRTVKLPAKPKYSWNGWS